MNFTCETTQYYKFLADTDSAKLLAVYKHIVGPAHAAEVKLTDLIVGGNYRPGNKWNTADGAVHLIQPNNNLFAEVLIAAQACILRQRTDGTPITDSDELIRCAGFGEPGRASDPKIGFVVNNKARQGFSITLRNPVALYMTRWQTSANWKKPDGTPVGNYFTLLRGKPSTAAGDDAMGLHLVFEVPPAEGFVVGDIKVGSRKIEFGGEIAEQINVGLFGVLCREGASHNSAFGCGAGPAGAMAVSADDVRAGHPVYRGTKVGK